MSQYTANHIQTLDVMSHIRHRPGMYISSNELEGRHHITLEIISNSIDEYLTGNCNKIIITLDNEGFICIEDNGRGIPIGTHPSGKPMLQAVFDTANTGGKFNNSGDSGYNTSGGLNGIGAKATNAVSSRFEASTTREGKRETVVFEKGKLISHNITPFDKNIRGTTVRFKPDQEVFIDGIHLDYDKLEKQIQELSFLCNNLEFILNDNRTKKQTQKIFKSSNGIIDYINHLNKGKTLLTNIFYCSTIKDNIGVEIGLQYNSGYSDLYKLYTNNIPNTGGTHLTGFRTALTRVVNDYAREKKILKEKDSNLSGEDLKEGLTFVLSLKMPDPVFSGQTKEVLNSSEGRSIIEKLLSSELRQWLELNPQEGKAIINKALLSRKAREAARKAKETARKGVMSSGLNNPTLGKLADCISKNAEECELYLVEG